MEAMRIRHPAMTTSIAGWVVAAVGIVPTVPGALPTAAEARAELVSVATLVGSESVATLVGSESVATPASLRGMGMPAISLLASQPGLAPAAEVSGIVPMRQVVFPTGGSAANLISSDAAWVSYPARTRAIRAMDLRASLMSSGALAAQRTPFGAASRSSVVQ
jgi:hypothetical protein